MTHEIPADSSIPICDHDSCADPKRREYCNVEPRQPDGGALVNIEAIDYIFLKHDHPDTRVEYTNDGRMRYLMYRSDYIEETELDYPVQTSVRIVHTYDVLLHHDAYQIRIGWRVDRDDANEAFYETIYSLEQYPRVIHSTVEEFNLSTEVLKFGEAPEYVSRPMAPYDHEVLSGHLMNIDHAHDALAQLNEADSSP